MKPLIAVLLFGSFLAAQTVTPGLGPTGATGAVSATGGSGTELQYRGGATTLSALPGSSVSGSDLTLGGNLLTATILTNSEFSNGTCVTSKTITSANGNRQKVTLTNAQTCALTFTQPSAGTALIQLKVIQSAAGSFNGLISGGKWPGGSVPAITATSGAIDIAACYLDGTNTYCTISQDFR